MKSYERSKVCAQRRGRGRLQMRRRYERGLRALLDAARPSLRLLARDERAADPDWVFAVFRQADVEVDYAPQEILAAMRGLCPDEPVVALLPIQRLVDELTPEAATVERVLTFFERAREPVAEGELKVIVFHEGRYEFVAATVDALPCAGEA